MSALDDAITGVSPPECVHVQCCGWQRCQFLPDPIGPTLPPLVVDANGNVWGRIADPMTSKLWWYGSSRMVTWGSLCRMRDGERPLLPCDEEPGAFPWGPWIGADYDESVDRAKAELARRRGLVSA